MDFNDLVFPAPKTNLKEVLEIFKNDLLFVPKYKKGINISYIPCLLEESTYNKESNKYLIYFHGNAEDIFLSSKNLSLIKSSLPLHIISMEYPGYSIYNEEKSAETIEKDCIHLFDFLTKQCNIEPKDIIVCGRSIGTGPATYLSSQRNPGALILISPISSIKDTAKNLVGLMNFLVKDRFNNFDRIQEVTCPLLIIHGQKDTLIPFTDSIKLSERTSGPYELLLPENMNHNNLNLYDDFLEPIIHFLKRHGLLKNSKLKVVKEKKIDRRYFLFPPYLKKLSETLEN